MVKILGFEIYFFCPKTCNIYSIKAGKIKEIQPLQNRGSKLVYGLYKNGSRKIISKFEIIKRCIPAIEELEKEVF